ncbi:GGDEF domain-containing protein [Bacillus sp. BGMRC 2118]|nr:GGDEF domain-containing protein [Bacillus sp. BGMRC 2118]
MQQNSFKFNDYNTELIFSLLRWIFLLGAVVLFYFPPVAKELNYELHTFNVLLVVGFFYMAITQLTLHYLSNNQRVFSFLTKAGVVFDFIAFIWLLMLSGGVESLLFPIAYLIVMHATIYWRIIGSIISISSVGIAYTVILFIQFKTVTPVVLIHFILNMSFLLILGMFGALIVYRERKHQSEKNTYKTLVSKDFLTGLSNHRHFQEHLIECGNRDVTLAMLDIDYFKRVNDMYGHVIGDRVLTKMGEILMNTIPEGKGLSFRYGGEEFAILFYTSDGNEVKSYLTSLNEKLHETIFEVENDTFSITISIGVCSKQSNEKLNHHFVMHADSLLYKAKKMGRNQAIFEDGTILKNNFESMFIS